ncbi:MAG: sigma 54-interacting transcriptional regulator [Bacteriovoracales bacterium]|nr:sigma 54-interacting transcriptional regulator [Bacteriovoracales bacterium]
MPPQPIKVLIVEDEKIQSLSLERQLNSCFEENGILGNITIADSSDSAKSILKSNKYDIAFFDLYLNGGFEGLDLLGNFARQVQRPAILTSVEDFNVIEQAAKFGCKDYFSKPVKKQTLKSFIKRYQNQINRDEINNYILSKYITDDPQTIEQLFKIPNLKENPNPIYIAGPTGCGKQVTAQLIHDIICEGKGPLIEMNCSSLSIELAESELFGHEQGAFTGASHSKKGLFELADKGTIFLDEIGKMPLRLQDKLLKVIEQKKFTRVGGTREIYSNFNLISASCENLQYLVDQGQFRPDLMERIKGNTISLKGLRERKEDIKKLLEYFIKNHPSGRLLAVTSKAISILENYLWPGNVRELKHLVDKWQSEGLIRVDAEDLKELRQKEFKHKYTFLNDAIISYIKENGLSEINELILSEIIWYFYEDNDFNTMKTIEELKTNRRRFYKSKEIFQNNIQEKDNI